MNRWSFRCAILACSICTPTLAAAQSTPASSAGESGQYRLHKFAQAIGEETYEIRHDRGAVVLTDKFQFTDRGTPVPLDTTWRAAGDLTPIAFTTTGRSSRLSTIDDAVDIVNGKATIREAQTTRDASVPRRFFTIAGYSPVAQQMLMMRYWLRHGSPSSLAIFPRGTEVQIRSRGAKQVTVNGRRIRLTRYIVAGLIWGREVLWLDDRQNVVALVSTDAEFDHFEATAPGYEPLLAEFVREAGIDGMAALAELSRGLRSTQGGPLAIVGATLVDGTGRPAIPNSVVVVNRGRIVAAGPRATVSVPRDARIVDASNQTVIPGLWDMHAHFEQVEWGAIYLAAGVTTVRDVGNELEFIEAARDAIASGQGLGPRLLLAGIVDGSGPRAIGVQRVDSPADAARWVREYKNHGFAQMKIYSSATLESVRAICEEAHRAGMTVTGHIPDGIDIIQGVEAGMDQVNHIEFVLPPVTDQPAPDRPRTFAERLKAWASVDVNEPDMRRRIEFLKTHETVIDPTLALMEIVSHAAAQPLTNIELGLSKVAPELAEPLRNTGVEPGLATVAEQVFRNELALVGALHRAGVRIVAGTDQSVPGHSLHRELELYVRAGFTTMEAIQSATLVPAQVMGVSADVGTVEAGKRADLLLLDANPLEDIRNIRTGRYVVAAGVLYPTAALWESVGFKP